MELPTPKFPETYDPIVEAYFTAARDAEDTRELIEMNGESCGRRQQRILSGYAAWVGFGKYGQWSSRRGKKTKEDS